MPEFHPFTISAACDILAGRIRTHDGIEALVFEWGCDGICGNGWTKNKWLTIKRAAASEDAPTARTLSGEVSLARALIHEALKAHEDLRQSETWIKLIAGLRFDGFEVVTERAPDPRGGDDIFDKPREIEVRVLRRMLPQDLPGLDFREAESEVVALLRKHSLGVARGHLEQATSAFQRGDWAAANAQLRSFFEDYLNQIAVELGYKGPDDTKQKRDFLGGIEPQFLLASYNEWNANHQKPQYVQGLWSRMHPEGSHPGLSEEEDATFRLQITLVTARLFLRRFDQRRTLA